MARSVRQQVDTAAPSSAAPGNAVPPSPQEVETPGAVPASAAAGAAPVEGEKQRPDRVVGAIMLRVEGPAKGRWRAGRFFSREAVEIAVADLTDEDLLKIKGDPELTVTIVSAEG